MCSAAPTSLRCSPAPVWRHQTSDKMLTRFLLLLLLLLLKEECNFTFIKMSSSPSFIPSENDISQNVISSVLHRFLFSHKESWFYWLREAFGIADLSASCRIWQEKPWKVIQVCHVVRSSGCFFFSSAAQTGKKRLRAGKIWQEKSSAVVKSCRNLPHLAWKDKRFQPNTSDGWKSLLPAPCWEILNLKKSYTSVQMKLGFSSFRLETGLRCPASAWTSSRWVWRILTPLATPSCSGVLDLSLISFRNPALQASHTQAHAKSLLLIHHLQLCCICRNERDHVVVFALLMRCQVIYLWITCLEQPPCAVCIFFLSSLESCRSAIADATLCHPEFALTSCEPSGRAISILACPRVCWRWEWLIKQVWASTPILLHAKQELSSS